MYTACCHNKWYFDEAIDFLQVVRPTQWLGRFTESVLERGVIAGGVTGGTVGVVRACSAPPCAGPQTGFVRYYAAAVLLGVSAIALYFLISAS